MGSSSLYVLKLRLYFFFLFFFELMPALDNTLNCSGLCLENILLYTQEPQENIYLDVCRLLSGRGVRHFFLISVKFVLISIKFAK